MEITWNQIVTTRQTLRTHLAVGAGLRVEALRGDRVDLVDEDDGRAVLAREAEDLDRRGGRSVSRRLAKSWEIP